MKYNAGHPVKFDKITLVKQHLRNEYIFSQNVILRWGEPTPCHCVIKNLFFKGI